VEDGAEQGSAGQADDPRREACEVERKCEEDDEEVERGAVAVEQVDQSFEQDAGGDVEDPSGQQRLEEADPAGGFGAAEVGAEVLEGEDREAEDGGLGEAIFELADAVGEGAIEECFGGVGRFRRSKKPRMYIRGSVGVSRSHGFAVRVARLPFAS
jgi:hypothetical protein